MSYEPYPTQPEPQPGNQPLLPQYAPLYNPVKDGSLAGTLSVVSAGVSVLCSLVMAISFEPGFRDGIEVDGWTAAYTLAAIGGFLFLVGGFVSTGIWLFQARKNAEAISPDWSHARSAGWAWGGWVCPVVWWWFPFQVVRDVWRATARTGVATAQIGWWWGLWIVWGVLSRVSSRFEDEAIADEEFMSSAVVLDWLVFAVGLVTFVLWARVVHSITTMQNSWMRGTPPVTT